MAFLFDVEVIHLFIFLEEQALCLLDLMGFFSVLKASTMLKTFASSSVGQIH